MNPWVVGAAAAGCFVVVAAVVFFGMLLGAAIYARGERARFEADLAPLRVSIAEVADSFEHWTKRERRRGFVEKPEKPVDALTARQEQLRDVARRMP